MFFEPKLPFFAHAVERTGKSTQTQKHTALALRAESFFTKRLFLDDFCIKLYHFIFFESQISFKNVSKSMFKPLRE